MNRRNRILTGIVLLACSAPALAAPVELGRESFEGQAGAIGFTTQVPQFDEPTVATSDFFSVIPNNGTRLAGGILANGDGNSLFAGEDLDTTPYNNPATLSLTLNPFNITGKTSTSVRLLLAAPGTGPAAGGSQNFYDHSATAADIDFVRIEASVDGGPFNRLLQFSPTNAAPALNSTLSLDTDGDGLGGQGAVLTAAFQEFSASFPTGNSVQIRVVMHSNGTSEYICLDNIRIFGDSPATAPPSIGGVPGSVLVFPEGGAAAAVAPALTVTDTDSAVLPSASVAITGNFVSGEDVLAAGPAGVITAGDIVYSAATGTLTITRSAPLADYQAVLRSATYRNTNNSNPNTGTRQIRFSTTDGINSSNSPVREVQVTDNISLQSLPFTETFETDGRGTRYALDGRFTNGSALFDRGQPSGITNADGSFAVLAEDTLLDAAPVKSVNFLLNTAGRVNVTASVRLGTLGGAVFDTGDTIAVETSVDGGAYTTVGVFRSTTGSNAPLALDTDNNGTGDGTQLSAALQDFVFNLPLANTLGLRVRCQSNSTGERLVVDRLVVNGPLQQFSVNDASGPESTTTRTFTVTRTVSTGADTVNFATSDGTAVAGSDYSAASGTVTFADGQATGTFAVTVSSDNLVELDESFAVTLTSPSRGQLSDATGTGTLVNDDAAVLSLTGATVTEGDSGPASLVYTLSLSNPVDTEVVFARSTLTNGTAASGTDFTPQNALSTSIAANTTSGNFSVVVAGDHEPEATETVPVQLSALTAGGRNVAFAGGAATLGTTGSILDDDPVILAGTGSLGLKIGVSGKLTADSLTALATGGEGRPLTIASVQGTPTARGGTVSMADGWIFYQPAPGFSGVDSFTYQATDGFQTVTGTVQVAADAGIGQTRNILSITDEGTAKRLVALAIPGRTFRWQTTENLSSWANLGAPQVCPASGVMTQLDPTPPPGGRFYRLLETP